MQESLPSFRVDSGSVRLVFGLTVVDIALVVGVWMTLYLFWPNPFTFLFGAFVGRALVWGVRGLRRLLPPRAWRHAIGWLGQANCYDPGYDPHPVPLFPQVER